MVDEEQPVIHGWRCPTCIMIFDEAGLCPWCATFLKPLVEQIPE